MQIVTKRSKYSLKFVNIFNSKPHYKSNNISIQKKENSITSFFYHLMAIFLQKKETYKTNNLTT